MKKTIRWVIAATLICGASVFTACFTKEKPKVSATDDTSQFVTLTDAVPDAILEIRYFGTYNFVGTRIDGYLEPTALLTKHRRAIDLRFTMPIAHRWVLTTLCAGHRTCPTR